MSENENLDVKLQSLLDADDKLRAFSHSRGNEIAHQYDETNKKIIPTEPPEYLHLAAARKCAEAEYEAAIRKDERERIKALIDEREKITGPS
jgi:hypothetical protein